MKLRECKGKFVVYDSKGRVVVITRERKIAINLARKVDGKDNVKRNRRAKNTTKVNDVSHHNYVLPSHKLDDQFRRSND